MKYFLKLWFPVAVVTVVFTLTGRWKHDATLLEFARVCAWLDIAMVVWGLLLIVMNQPHGKHGRRG